MRPWPLETLTGLGAFGVYAMTACRTVFVGDTPEFALAAACWGVPHPPGYPLHTLLSALFVQLVPFGGFAQRANLFAAICAAAAVVLVARVARLLGGSPIASVGAALSLAFSTGLWTQAGAAEVYAFDTMLLAAAMLAVLLARNQPGQRRAAVAGIALGLWLGHRPVNVLLAPFLAGLVLLALRGRPGAGWSVGMAVACALASGLVYLYLPLASARDPVLDIGDPQAWPEFVSVVSAETYFRHLTSGSAELAWARVGQWLRALPLDLGAAALVGIAGLAITWRRGERALGAALAAIVVVNVAFSARYNILDVAPYYLPASVVLASLAGRGADVLLGRYAWVVVPLALAMIPLHFEQCDLSESRLVDRYARDVLGQAQPRALVISSGDSSTHALWYLQGAERTRPDVIVVSPGHVHPWYLRQLARRHPDVAWPPVGAAEQGVWVRALIAAELHRRPIYLLDPPELRARSWGLDELLQEWCGRVEGPMFRLGRIDAPRAAADRDRALAFWDAAPPIVAPGLEAADVQVGMTAFHYLVARFFLAAELVEANLLQSAAAQLRAIVASDPDRIERRMAAAYRTIGRDLPALALGQRAQRALAARDARSMLAALAGE